MQRTWVALERTWITLDILVKVEPPIISEHFLIVAEIMSGVTSHSPATHVTKRQ